MITVKGSVGTSVLVEGNANVTLSEDTLKIEDRQMSTPSAWEIENWIRDSMGYHYPDLDVRNLDYERLVRVFAEMLVPVLNNLNMQQGELFSDHAREDLVREAVIQVESNLEPVEGTTNLRQSVAVIARQEAADVMAKGIESLKSLVMSNLMATMRKRFPPPPESDWDDDPFTPGITCPKCKMTSYNLNDIEHRWCGNCNQHHEDMA